VLNGLVLREWRRVEEPGADRHRVDLAVALLDNRDFHDSLLRALLEHAMFVSGVGLSYRMLSTTTSTSQGRSVPFFFGLVVFLFFICSLLVDAC
jgi:hypothetical protein